MRLKLNSEQMEHFMTAVSSLDEQKLIKAHEEGALWNMKFTDMAALTLHGLPLVVVSEFGEVTTTSMWEEL